MRNPTPGNRGAFTGVHTVMVISRVAGLPMPQTLADDLLLRNCAAHFGSPQPISNRSLEEYDTDE